MDVLQANIENKNRQKESLELDVGSIEEMWTEDESAKKESDLGKYSVVMYSFNPV